MILPSSDTPIGKWVANCPELIPVLEKHQIDYCCGGNKSLSDACDKAGVGLDSILSELNQVVTKLDDEPHKDWSAVALTELCDHIERTHHAYLLKTLPDLAKLVAKVRNAHSDRHPELCDLESTFRELCAELIPHMMKEEKILFPAIRRMETVDPQTNNPFGSVQNPINMMEHEHDNAGNALRKLRELTNDFIVPANACTSYQAMLTGLKNLEADLHQHIHKENNILFPKAVLLEASLIGV